MELKELKDLLKLLRAQGVQQYMTPDLTLVLNENVPVTKRQAQAEVESDEQELSPEEEAERLLFYSATPPIDSSDQ